MAPRDYAVPIAADQRDDLSWGGHHARTGDRRCGRDRRPRHDLLHRRHRLSRRRTRPDGLQPGAQHGPDHLRRPLREHGTGDARAPEGRNPTHGVENRWRVGGSCPAGPSSIGSRLAGIVIQLVAPERGNWRDIGGCLGAFRHARRALASSFDRPVAEDRGLACRFTGSPEEPRTSRAARAGRHERDGKRHG